MVVDRLDRRENQTAREMLHDIAAVAVYPLRTTADVLHTK